jgi:hypothetical protein
MHKHFNPFDLTNEELLEMAPEQQKIDIFETDPFTQYVGTSFDPGYKPQVFANPINSEFKLPGFNEDSHHSVPEIEARFNKELRTQEMYDKYIKDFGSQYIYGSNETDSSRSKLHQLLAGVDNMALQYGMSKNQVDQLKAKIMQSHLFDHLSEKQVRDELSISIPGNVKPTQRPTEFESPKEDKPTVFETPQRPAATAAGDPGEDEVGGAAAGDLGPAIGDTSTDGQTNPADELLRGKKSKVPLNKMVAEYRETFLKKLRQHSDLVSYIGHNFTQLNGKKFRKILTKKYMDDKLVGVLNRKGNESIHRIVVLIERSSPTGDIAFGANISEKEARLIRYFLEYAIKELKYEPDLRGHE